MSIEIKQDDLSGDAIVRFVEAHLQAMKAITPPESVHALGADALRAPDITFWSAWEGDVLVGCGALKALGRDGGEIKAMRTADAYRRQGIARQILEHIVGEAQRRGYRQLYLETGAGVAFEPARRLYQQHGFGYCGPFADYVDDPNSVFMWKDVG